MLISQRQVQTFLYLAILLFHIGMEFGNNKSLTSTENELTDGTSNFFTSAAARFSFNNARLGVSSHCIRTCNSSDKCSQLGFPRFASSYKSEVSNS